MTALPDDAPSWVAAVFFVLAIVVALGRSLSEASEVYAKLFGPLGRRWRRRADERAQRRRDEGPKVLTRQQVQQMVDTAVEKATMDLTNELHELTEYWAYDTKWHRDALTATSEGTAFADHLSLTQWRLLRAYQGGGTQ